MKKFIFSKSFILTWISFSIVCGIVSNINLSLFFGFLWGLGLAVLALIMLPIKISEALRSGNSVALKFLFPFCLIGFVLCVWLAPAWGDEISKLRFQYAINDYTSIASRISSGKIGTTEVLNRVDIQSIGRLPNGVIDIMAARCKGGAVVMFLTASGGRIHKGYLYKDEGLIQKCGNIVPTYYSLYHLQGDWYEFSN